MHLAQELLMNIQCSGGSRSFAKETSALKMRSAVVIGSWQWPTESITEADPLTTTQEIAKEFNINHSMVIRCLKQIGKVKNLIRGCLLSWLKIKTIVILKCCLLLLYATKTNHFWIGLWHAMNSAFYMTTGNDQLSGWTEKKLQSTSQSQRKVMVTVWWPAARLIHYSFLNPGKTITFEKYVQQMNEMHWKCQLLQPALANRTSPTLFHDSAWLHVAQPELQQLNKAGYAAMLHPPYSPDFLPTTTTASRILTTFCRDNASTASRRQKRVCKSPSNPEPQTFML